MAKQRCAGAGRGARGWHMESSCRRCWRRVAGRDGECLLSGYCNSPPQKREKGHFISCRSTPMVGNGGDCAVTTPWHRPTTSSGAVRLTGPRVGAGSWDPTSLMMSAPGRVHPALFPFSKPTSRACNGHCPSPAPILARLKAFNLVTKSSSTLIARGAWLCPSSTGVPWLRGPPLPSPLSSGVMMMIPGCPSRRGGGGSS